MSTLTRTHSASHSPPSLPSFAQTFSNLSHAGASASMVNLAKISIARSTPLGADTDTLPPIHNVVIEQHEQSDLDGHPNSSANMRKGLKRALDHNDHEGKRSAEREDDAQRASAPVKRESSPSPSPDVSPDQHNASSSPLRRPTKKRRINAAPGSKTQPIPDRDSPASPVMAGFAVPNSDQGAIEQVRAMLSIKQKQKEIIAQRRGSAAGLLQSPSNPTPARPGAPARKQSSTSTGSAQTASSPPQHPSPQQQHAQPTSHPTPPHHFSPPQQSLPAPNNSFLNSRRRRGTLQVNGHAHAISSESVPHPPAQPPRLPPPILTPSSTTSTSHAFQHPPPPQSQSQAQTPIPRTPAIAKSTATRAAPPKPLTIAPHPHSRHLEPLVHSAPVIGGFGPVRVPELPPIPITPGGRRISGGAVGMSGSSGANVAIAKSGGMRMGALGLGRVGLPSTSLTGTVPPTPAYASLASQQRQPATSHDGKAGFLQLFENFYDSLADSRLLKQWLQEQLVKSNGLLEQLGKFEKGREGGGLTLAQVEELIERRVAPMRNEVDGLKRRVDELEEMLYRERQRGGARHDSYSAHHHPEMEEDPAAKALSKHGSTTTRVSEASGYAFPERRDEAGEREKERDQGRDREKERGSPVGSLRRSPPSSSSSFDQHRLSTSAVRLETGPPSSQHAHMHPVFPLSSVSSQHRPSPLGLDRDGGREREHERERERDSARGWDRRRTLADGPGGASHAAANSASNGRNDTARDRDRDRDFDHAPPPSSSS